MRSQAHGSPLVGRLRQLRPSILNMRPILCSQRFDIGTVWAPDRFLSTAVYDGGLEEGVLSPSQPRLPITASSTLKAEVVAKYQLHDCLTAEFCLIMGDDRLNSDRRYGVSHAQHLG